MERRRCAVARRPVAAAVARRFVRERGGGTRDRRDGPRRARSRLARLDLERRRPNAADSPAILAPTGLAIGGPFPVLLAHHGEPSNRIASLWAINGVASVAGGIMTVLRLAGRWLDARACRRCRVVPGGGGRGAGPSRLAKGLLVTPGSVSWSRERRTELDGRRGALVARRGCVARAISRDRGQPAVVERGARAADSANRSRSIRRSGVNLDDAWRGLAAHERDVSSYGELRRAELVQLGVTDVDVGTEPDYVALALDVYRERSYKAATFNVGGAQRASAACRALMDAIPEIDWRAQKQG